MGKPSDAPGQSPWGFFFLQAASSADICRAAALLAHGRLVALPSETVYGLAGNAFDPGAVGRIFQVKGRPLLDPLIVHGLHAEALTAVAHFGRAAQRLAKALWPGPLTLVLPRRSGVPGLVTAGLPTVAVRCPAHTAFRRVLGRCGFPLAAPSANPFGYLSPTRAEHVRDSLGDRLPYILDGGPCTHGVESTIVSLRDPQRPEILRPGPISPGHICEVLGQAVPVRPRTRRESPGETALEAPGTSARHYSPRKPLRLFQSATPPPGSTPATAVVLLKRPQKLANQHTYWLSESGDLREAAANVFDLLRRLDAEPSIRSLQVEQPAPDETGFGLALADRLLRAAAR
ncbi:MAG: L-threonylcarbamoyladenylate synthase [Opitutales bacterium]